MPLWYTSALIPDVSDKPFSPDDLLHEFRERHSLVRSALCLIDDGTGIEVCLDHITVTDVSGRFRTLYDGKPDIDGIAVEYPGKCLCYDAGYP